MKKKRHEDGMFEPHEVKVLTPEDRGTAEAEALLAEAKRLSTPEGLIAEYRTETKRRLAELEAEYPDDDSGWAAVDA